VSVDKTLAKVEADLAAGDLVMACRRLQGLVGSFPHRLDLRERLAQVYRQRGDQVRAGRWSYLAEQRVPVEVAAFEKSARRPVQRMRALAWVTAPETASTAVARQRLADLLEVARINNRDQGLTYEELRSATSTTTDRATLTGRIFVAMVITVLCVACVLTLVGLLYGAWVVLSRSS